VKILKLTAENIKKLVAVEITPSGNMVQITGPNGSGKSSVLDAIFWALAGTSGVDAVPVRTGAQKARIRLDLGDLIITRRFTEGGGTSLVVENGEGARYPSPQSMLDALLGALSFDPLAFARMDTRAQMEAVRKIVPLDVDLDALDATIKAAEEARRDAKLQAKSFHARRAAVIVDVTLSQESVDVQALLAEHRDAVARTAERDAKIRRREQIHVELDETAHRVDELRRQADLLEEHQSHLEEQREQLSELIGGDAGIGVTPDAILAEIANAEKINANANAAKEDAHLREAIERAERQTVEADADIDTRRAEKAAAMARAPMPIDGLAFGEDGLLYNGIPLAQASSAEQLRVSVAIAMKLNPTLRVLRIKDGSLLDLSSLSLVAEMADAEDYQVWIERVDTTGKVGIVLSDGHVVVEGTP